MAEEVTQGKVGAIFALEVSSFARSSSDWHRLLELCRWTDVLITDEYGKARRRFTLENPFPARATDDAGNRIVGFGLIYKSDYTISGHCAIVYGPGVDVHAVANTVGNAKETEKLNQLITVSAIE